MELVSRPWKPQDLLDDLQMYIDEEPDNYLNGRRTAMCMARDYLKEHFEQKPKWISVEERLPSGWWVEPGTGYREPEEYIVFVKGAIRPTFANFIDGKFMRPDAIYRGDGSGFADEITHWMPLPEPPEV